MNTRDSAPLLPDALTLTAELVQIPAPPGEELLVRKYLSEHISRLGVAHRIDDKGNLLAAHDPAAFDSPHIVVCAHMDEIALIVSGYGENGMLLVAPLGGTHPFKWGEGVVEIMAHDGVRVPGVLGFGGIHTTHAASAIQIHRDGNAVQWESARLTTGLTRNQMNELGVGIGSRVVLGASRRTLTHLGGGLVTAPFLDDRADCAAWLHTFAETDAQSAPGTLFIATASEEVGGHGILYALRGLKTRPNNVIALEIGPNVPDAPLIINDSPVLWTSDGYASVAPSLIYAVCRAAESISLPIQRQHLSRGGSDASICAAMGLCAFPITLAFAAENSHGQEIMHRDAPANLAALTTAVVGAI